MRAISGAILTATACIGLGLFAWAAGSRFADYEYIGPDDKAQWLLLEDLDTGLLTALVLLVGGLLVGLVVAFYGLAEHHRRRQLEMLRDYGYIEIPTLFGPPVRLVPLQPRPKD